MCFIWKACLMVLTRFYAYLCHYIFLAYIFLDFAAWTHPWPTRQPVVETFHVHPKEAWSPVSEQLKPQAWKIHVFNTVSCILLRKQLNVIFENVVLRLPLPNHLAVSISILPSKSLTNGSCLLLLPRNLEKGAWLMLTIQSYPTSHLESNKTCFAKRLS